MKVEYLCKSKIQRFKTNNSAVNISSTLPVGKKEHRAKNHFESWEPH